MTQEQKQLLLIDLCARLPYGIKCKLSADGVSLVEDLQLAGLSQFLYGRLDVIPYLRPISSMTAEEINEYENFIANEKDDLIRFCNELVFYNTHHLDYRGLIKMGLALEAPEDMYKTE